VRAQSGGFRAPFPLHKLNTTKDRLMDILDSKNDTEILLSVVAEAAKASAEIKTAKNDIEKAQNRLRFVLMLAHKLIDRKKD
jgi:glutamine phosphoribosylpyrophosphate amidotransferase